MSQETSDVPTTLKDASPPTVDNTIAPAVEDDTRRTGVSEAVPAADPAAEAAAPAPRVRRRRRRGGRGRGRGRATQPAPLDGATPDAEVMEPASAPVAVVGHDGDSAPTPASTAGVQAESTAVVQEVDQPPRRPRRRRGGRGRSRTPGSAQQEVDAAEAADLPDAPAVATEADTDTRSGAAPGAVNRAGSSAAPRKTRSAAVETSTPPVESQTAPVAAEKAPALPRGATRTRRTRPSWQRRRDAQRPQAMVQNKTMLITELGDRHQIAVLEDRELIEHYITRLGARSMVGSIFLGKVQNVLPGMEAAFIDIGRGRNAVLYAGEVSYDEEIEGESRRIEHVLKAGQNVVVQVTKDPIGGKGARLTQDISLPGRYLVFVPNSDVFGISRRLPDRERARLKDILKQVKPANHGVIVRTAAEGADAEGLRSDLERLTAQWSGIDKSAKRGKAPRVLYEEPELTVRVVRDLFIGGEFKEIVTDSDEISRRIVEYLQDVAPELAERVRMHDGALPLLEAYHVVEQIHKALDRKVWLPSGGYIVIDRTEAMTVIDVNTGKHVGKANLEETVTKTNLEAAAEIARQLRLRDIGGIIIIDFIDMLLERNQDRLVETLKNALAQDKTRSQVFNISPLGVLEVTRKRISAGLLESFSETCPTCEGRGILLTHKV